MNALSARCSLLAALVVGFAAIFTLKRLRSVARGPRRFPEQHSSRVSLIGALVMAAFVSLRRSPR
jgi:hypothetical protein